MIKDAKWIGFVEDIGTVCPKFKKEFGIYDKILKAELSITAIGMYEAELNGKRIGNFIFAPGLTSYRNRLQYQTYDVTDMLKADNELSITVGTGWFRGNISNHSPEIHNTPCGIISELKITYVSEKVETIITDESWSVYKSNILASDLYNGEIYDASAYSKFKTNAVIIDLSKDNLIPQEGEIVCEHEHIRPKKLITAPNGDKIIDFGQNFAGYVEFKINAHKGDKIRCSFAEILDVEGNFYTENYRTAQAKLEYICLDNEQIYKPHFTFMGFRYLRLDEYPADINLDDFCGIAVYSNMERNGSIMTANKKINRLFENTLWSQRANFIDIPTDCPQRDERMGWTGDAQVFAKTAAYNFGVLKFFQKWLGDVRAEQSDLGAIPDTVPNFWQLKTSSTAWGDVICIIPWTMYCMYGDTGVLKANFDAMKKWIDYITGDTIDKYLWTCKDNDKALWKKHYGDWLALDAPYGSYKGATDDDFIASAFYAYSTSLVVKAGKALNEDIKEYERLYENIVKTFKRKFNQFTTQTEHVLALQFNLCDDKQSVADSLANLIKRNGNKLQTGFVGTPYLLHVLSENGQTETAYSLLLQEGYPSWLYEVNHGATTIWEHWDGIRDDGTLWSSDMNSYNHYAYGSVIDWIYSCAAGIKYDEKNPGFKKVVIAPQPDQRLGQLEVNFKTVYGIIRSAWVYSVDSIRYEITTPVPAEIIIDGKEYSVPAGRYIF